MNIYGEFMFKKSKDNTAENRIICDEKLQHIAFIMDGNGRWAKKQGKPRNHGHSKVAERVKDVVSWSFEAGIKCVSLYAFSSENWGRPKEEVDKILAEIENAEYKVNSVKRQVAYSKPPAPYPPAPYPAYPLPFTASEPNLSY